MRNKISHLTKEALINLFLFTCGMLSTTKGFTNMQPDEVVDWVLASWESYKKPDIKKDA